MRALELLHDYLSRVEARLRALALARGAAVVAAAALAGTMAGVLLANAFAFVAPGVLAARLLLFLAVALALAFGIAAPLLRLGRKQTAHAIERRHPEFEQRLITIAECGDEPDPFLPLLAADSLRLSERAAPEELASVPRVAAYAGAAAACAAGVAWLALFGPGFFGYGASLLWGGVPKGGARPYYDIVVTPGDRTVRKRADQQVTAHLVGFQAQRVRVLARFSGASKWEEAEMRPGAQGQDYEFLFAGLPDSLDYYVEASGVRSKQYRLTVADLPSVKRIRVTYRYPAWTGAPPAVEDPGGDLRAIEGTVAEVQVETDKPLAAGELLLDDGRRFPLRNGAARVPIEKDGSYHVATADVRLSEDYFIEAQQDRPPSVRIARPGRDARTSPIEEVTVTVEGKDDFGLRELALHYSVNAAPEKVMPLLPRAGEREARGTTLIALEDFKLSPGDIVSIYATARDARATARTDMFFIEAQPFEREYTQSQQSGGRQGGGQQGEEDRQISQRQKEIIAATWNQVRDPSGAAAENAKFLSGVQSKLRDQARSLVNRMRSRELAGASDSFKSFVEDMDKAIEAMGPASEKLGARDWRSALPPEQKALQHLLRAEATFRNIQVAFGQRGGGGGGGRGNQGRDLEGLFDLELDTEKNQYETGQQSASEQRQREIDEAMAKLERLARRQQEIADRQRNNPRQMAEQRWQQEMLRREAEQLRRQMEQMQQGGQLDRAINQVEQAMRDMRQSNAQGAAGRLRQAQEAVGGMQRASAGREMDNLVRRADEMAARQRDFNNRLRQSLSERRPADPLAREKDQMAEEAQRMEDDMQRAARGMASAEREAASKLRQALGNLQQEELPTRMKWSAEALRRGLGTYAAMREALTTQALENLRQQLREAQRSLGGGQPQPQQGGAMERALAATERLREQLGRAAGSERRDDYGAMNRGDRQPPPGGVDLERTIREGARVLARLRQALAASPELARNVDALIREMQRLDPKRFPGNPQLLERLTSQVAGLEVELRRQLDNGSTVRGASSEPPPPGYADAVAEYFRRLSREPR
ncbi:MAG: DUF4175 family protein [Bryobacteraceae bacterium]